ncbi:hypothetical protein C2G38_2122289 [Gigaspora rosea]|uniref:Uncharacterized protein n=1 Tax=Gigaspora rosea TaxID=44941 RepID=A0A397U0G7_9GLOM|nr:hypothetical protein C2G38_2122289 [Gigaspora rosea]
MYVYIICYHYNLLVPNNFVLCTHIGLYIYCKQSSSQIQTRSEHRSDRIRKICAP